MTIHEIITDGKNKVVIYKPEKFETEPIVKPFCHSNFNRCKKDLIKILKKNSNTHLTKKIILNG